MQSRINDFHAQDAVVLAISADAVEDLRVVADAYKLDFRLLSDPDLQLVDALGLRHVEAGWTGGDISRPATFVADREGAIAWRDLTENWRVRVPPDGILEELAKLP